MRSVILPLVVVLTVAVSCVERRTGDGADCGIEFPLEEMREGDLAFRRGRSFASHAVMAAGERRMYSHVGVLVREGDSWRVIHAVPGETESAADFERVKDETLEQFFASGRATHGELFHTGLSDSAAVSHIREEALRMARDSVRFDRDYDLSTRDAVYCTEFVYLLYGDVGVDLSEGRRTKVNVPLLSRECLLPDDILLYSGNESYFRY